MNILNFCTVSVIAISISACDSNADPTPKDVGSTSTPAPDPTPSESIDSNTVLTPKDVDSTATTDPDPAPSESTDSPPVQTTKDVDSTSTTAPDPALSESIPCDNVECEDNNKALIEQIYTDIINGGQSGLVSAIFDENFIQHNDAIGDGVEGQADFFASMNMETPDHVATTKHVVADGDYVAVHWHYSDTPANEFLGQANIDLYKLNGNLVVEQWNAAMTPNEDTASGNSVFSDLYDYGDTQPNSDVTIEETNKTLVTAYYLDLFNNQNVALLDEHWDENYLQHNFWVPNGSEALRDFVNGGETGGLTIFLSLSEDDLVWTFSGSGEDNLSTTDLWRFDNNANKIVEHWDVF